MLSLIVIKGSEHLPISVNDAKLFLKITHSEEDHLIQRMIEAASTSFESYTSKALLVKQWKATYATPTHVELFLPVRYVQKINSITLVTPCSSKYELQHKSFCLIGDKVIFRTATMGELMEIQFEAGIAYTPDELASDIQEALMEHVAHMYEHRSSSNVFHLSRYNIFMERKI